MTDGKPTGEHSDDPRARRARRGFFWGCLAGCIVSAIIIVATTYFSRLLPAPVPTSESAAQDSASLPPEEAIAPLDRVASIAGPQPAPRQAAIMLASMAVPATTEQLQLEAEGVANQLRTQYPDLAEALHVVAIFHAQMRHSGEAEKIWSKCIELAPDHVEYYVNLAAIAMERGNSELAVETLQQALEAHCSSPDVYHHLAVSLTKLGRCEEAEQVIQEGLAAYPQFPSAWLVLGQAQLKLGKAAEAEASLRKAVQQGSRSPPAYFALGNACARQGKREEAAEFRKVFAKLKESRPLDVQQRFQILSSAEARRTAVAVLGEAAMVHIWQENSLEAERLFLRAIALEPTSVSSCQALADLYKKAGMAVEEQVVRRRLIQIEPFNLVNYLNLATICAQLGQSESAEAALKLAIAISPDAIDAYTTLAQFYIQSGKAGHARWYAQEAVRRDPTAERYMLLGATCRLLGDDAEAQVAFAKAKQMQPDGQP
jgi:tetratricopeptide (TPR) repeat protein